MTKERERLERLERLEREIARLEVEKSDGGLEEGGREGGCVDVHVSINHHQESKRLTAFKEARNRVDNGTYGVCRECGQPISAERLKALPETDFCSSCQKKRERKQGLFS